MAFVALLLSTSAPLAAQQPETAAQPAAAGPRTYTPADFARFAPKNALDMLRQVPGFSIREATQERGLGQATGNVLINGQRISGKSNDASTEISRIPAQNVVRIEIVDGATLDIPGLSGQVANVVAKAGGLTGQFAWRPDIRAHFTKPQLTSGEASVSGKRGSVDYTLGFQNSANHGGAGGGTDIYDAGFNFIEHRDDAWRSDRNAPKLSGRFAYDGPGSSVGNLNLGYQQVFSNYREKGSRIGPGLIDRTRLVRDKEEGYNYELGGDYELPVGPGRLKVIGLNRFIHSPSDSRVVTDFADGSPSSGSRFARVGDTSERIGRAEYRWKAGRADWQLSFEGAFNALDNVSHLFLLRPSGDFEEVPLPGGTAEVKEDRYEAMASYGRSLTSTLSLQLSAGGEYSQLRQIGGGGLARTFWRPKGLVSLAWKASPRTSVNLKLQRRVGQLNFYDFLASVNLNEDRENAGNPDLVPPQRWEADLELVQNLGSYGSTNLRLFGRIIEDIVDIIPIGATGESPGNIDRADILGLEWKSTFNFDPFGWQGAKLDARLLLQDSKVEDPLTGERREISNNTLRLVELSFRHDVPKTDFAWGGNFFHHLPAFNYRLTEVGRQWEGPVWASLFLEHKDVLGLTVRATASNLLNARSMWDRTVFVGRRTGPVSFYERRDRLIGPILSLSISGRF